jgi:hypothetical protein
MRSVKTDLPLKTAERAIVILRDLPVHQCGSCAHYLIDDAVLEHIDGILNRIDGAAELEIVRYAA